MTCENCEARRRLVRDALFNARVIEAGGHIAKGIAEAIGVKEKTALAESTEVPAVPDKTPKKAPKTGGLKDV